MSDIKNERALYLFLCGVNASTAQLCGKESLDIAQRNRLSSVKAEKMLVNYNKFTEKIAEPGYKPKSECEKLAFRAMNGNTDELMEKYEELKKN